MSNNPILHATIKGEGFPLLILHGYFGMSDNWKTLGNKFSEDYQVHLIDQRNHGRSFHADAFNYDLMVEDLHNYIQHHNLQKVHVLGHSMGGKTAIEMAAIAQERIDQLVIVDIAPVQYSLSAHSDVLAALNAVEPATLNDRQDADATIARWIDDPNLRQFLMTNLQRSGGQFSWRINRGTTRCAHY